jgi:hypothetical protein
LRKMPPCHTRAMVVFFSLCLALMAAQEKERKEAHELDAREPLVVILPPPPFIDAKEEKGKLRVRFREIGTDRVQKYNIYDMRDAKWHLLGSIEGPPAMLSSCKPGTSSYAIAAVDKSEQEGARTRFTADFSCSRAEISKAK